MAPVLYEHIDSNNVRIGTKWFKHEKKYFHNMDMNLTVDRIDGVLIFHDPFCKQFISNNWYLDEEIGRL